MKKYNVILYIISFILGIFSLTGCNKSAQELGDCYIEGQDQQFMYSDGSMQKIARTENGYYFFAGEYLYYMDFESMRPIIMCNKPNCLHNEETNLEKRVDCNALFTENYFLSYYDGYLYTTVKQYKSSTNKTELIRVALDGTSRKKVFEFDVLPTAIAIHRGKLYYSGTAFNDEGNAVYALKEVSLGKWHAKPKVLYEGELAKGSIQQIKCYGEHVYFTELTINDEVQIVRQMCYNNVKNEVIRICTQDDKLYPQSISIVNGKLYYTIFNGNYKDEQNNIVYRAELDGSNGAPCFEMPVLARISSDGNKLIVEDLVTKSEKSDEQKSISLYSEDGEVLGEFLTNQLSHVHDTFPGDEKYLFVVNYADKCYEMQAVDKQKLSENKVEVNKLFKMEQEKLYPEIIVHN